MRVTDAKSIFRDLVATYFAGAMVIFSEQSRMAKPTLALVTIRFGNVTRPYRPNVRYYQGEPVGYYLSKVAVTVENFTHGRPLKDGLGNVYAYENMAEDDMLSFADFLNSEYVLNWCHKNDVSITIEGDVQDMTGLVNDSNYEYRARLNLSFYFVQYAVGAAGTLLESSLVKGQDGRYYIDPYSEQTSSGGGTDVLARETTGYFNDVEITEENE